MKWILFIKDKNTFAFGVFFISPPKINYLIVSETPSVANDHAKRMKSTVDLGVFLS